MSSGDCSESRAAVSTVVAGVLRRPEFHRAYVVLESMHSAWPAEVAAPDCLPLMEFQWNEWLSQLQKEQGRGEVCDRQEHVVVLLDGQPVTGLSNLLKWASDNYGYQDTRSLSDYESVARDAYNKYISNPQRDFVFFDVCVEGDLIGRLVFELNRALCPLTAENFVCLCMGEKGIGEEGGGGRRRGGEEGGGVRLSYVNSLIHRVVPGGWVQGGDICGGTGEGGVSIYGKTFADESFAVLHSSAGVLGMANHGRNTNNSQFYITLAPTPWMDRQYVAFGRVVEGSKVLHRLACVETNGSDRPLQRCQVSNCGHLPSLTAT